MRGRAGSYAPTASGTSATAEGEDETGTAADGAIASHRPQSATKAASPLATAADLEEMRGYATKVSDAIKAFADYQPGIQPRDARQAAYEIIEAANSALLVYGETSPQLAPSVSTATVFLRNILSDIPATGAVLAARDYVEAAESIAKFVARHVAARTAVRATVT
jgi:hypothetical protein